MNRTAPDAGELIAGQTVRHGTGITANRAFPTETYPGHLDPFVLFEQFYIDPETGFPMHSHRGFEIVSYMIEGGMEHEDSLGVSHTARENTAMHITAGSGIRHSEFPAHGAACSGLQLWVNLPRANKDIEPEYTDASAAALPTDHHDGATVTTVVGEGSPLQTHTTMEYRDVTVTGEWTWPVPDGWSGFLYGVADSGSIEGDEFSTGDVVPVPEGRDVTVRSAESLRLVAVAGRPHGDPIELRGPVVL
ncbi:pirin family protein [Halorhabdus rudnickae]|uniref:pirin family protein n=1 Tax=Halorhabdus rudnickae TaxID=1775544 RepID=UPI0010844BA7|nr:pirin family protein [Halorhabdus rudnickae]